MTSTPGRADDGVDDDDVDDDDGVDDGAAHSRWAAAPQGQDGARLDLPWADLERLLVVAAHPGDETLGAEALIAQATAFGLEVHVVLLAGGRTCHPHSPTDPPERPAQPRLAESEAALRLLAPRARLTHLDPPCGRVSECDAAVDAVVRAVGERGTRTLLCAPGQHGHPDHEDAGRIARTAAYRTDALLIDPSRPGHWGPPAQAPDDPFELLHRDAEDPWGVATRWYERRKRQVTLAALPGPRYRRALEVGCSVGALAAELAQRCDEVLAIDGSATAVERANATLASLATARAMRMTVPAQWPEGTFDLIVLSEVGYFLSPRQLHALMGRVAGSLEPGGALVLCHWLHPITGWPLDGQRVHDRARAALGRAPDVVHREADFLLEVYGGCGPAGEQQRP
ncbi:MAG TPA: bifunctional PIG-L family deacetylase/class I SAM-dependent methyltransferase [Intrasporangium sp.]|uniref:bifunctional PIG-L family deacetylase/class I SAM-dependent methyltransferase n=1 Tax=Intrasporangium sp. TaxID=1925024 RepID=UPI002D76EEDB|nr:bifunctional PIG-L family deacetylase/class I SAM-dependent methyltransferase [Intrasporangium sp.]HET7399525.1 bifunctional PIG-L family deacetylase/class I SAM-dependent methyltransferase [Intrasporangium sp.]